MKKKITVSIVLACLILGAGKLYSYTNSEEFRQLQEERATELRVNVDRFMNNEPVSLNSFYWSIEGSIDVNVLEVAMNRGDITEEEYHAFRQSELALIRTDNLTE